MYVPFVFSRYSQEANLKAFSEPLYEPCYTSVFQGCIWVIFSLPYLKMPSYGEELGGHGESLSDPRSKDKRKLRYF